MSKPGTVYIENCADCIVTVDGRQFTPHDGESITLRLGGTVEYLRVGADIQLIKAQLDALEGEPNGQGKQMALLMAKLDSLAPQIASLVKSWTWTDDDGKDMLLPSVDPKTLAKLRPEEYFYIFARATNAETKEARKNV